MIHFDHLHVMNLIGVCIDLAETPYIIMPYMANGSLLGYLKKERPNLTVTEEVGEERVSLQRKSNNLLWQSQVYKRNATKLELLPLN